MRVFSWSGDLNDENVVSKVESSAVVGMKVDVLPQSYETVFVNNKVINTDITNFILSIISSIVFTLRQIIIKLNMSHQYLPNSQQQLQRLKIQIQSFINKLNTQITQNKEDRKLIVKNISHIETLQLRLKLIEKCGEFSMLRLTHLQQIHKHYCCHVFKTGKHMTFERLEYDRIHMTMERFFLFLKDFQLTSMLVDGKHKEVVEKNTIITIFKRVSANSRVLSFEEFIQCIEKLGVIYYDQKQHFFDKIQERKKQMVKIRKQIQKRKIKRLKLNGIQVKEPLSDSQQEGNQQNNQQNNKQQKGVDSEQNIVQENQEKDKTQKVEHNNQNDDLIDDLMNNNQIEDPNEEVKKLAEQARQENYAIFQQKQHQQQKQTDLLTLTSAQKIQYYYSLLNIDSLVDFKNKLTDLNLLVYTNHRKEDKEKKQKTLSQSNIAAISAQEEQRLRKLKEKMNMKKEKMKERPLPKPSAEQAKKEQENSRKRKELKKQREKANKQTKHEIEKQVIAKKVEKVKESQKKIQFKDNQVSWNMLQKISLQQMKLKQFNPNKLYTIDDQDRYFLEQYGYRNGNKQINKLQNRERQSLSVVENAKKRVDQVERTQKKNQKINTKRLGKIVKGNF